MLEPDFIPEDGKLCGNCVFYEICPYDWECATLNRIEIFEAYEHVRNGDSTEKVR